MTDLAHGWGVRRKVVGEAWRFIGYCTCGYATPEMFTQEDAARRVSEHATKATA